MELQGALGKLSEAGFGLYAISYDSVEVLAGFAEKYGITYPLLSDAGSEVINRLGILNQDAAPAVAGIPHPGIFVLNADGTVRSKHFYESYRERDTGSGVLNHILGLPSEPRDKLIRADADGLEVSATLDNPSYAWGQRLWLSVEFDIPKGVHLYGRPIPAGYFPVDVTVAPIERVRIGDPLWPEPLPFRLAGLDEEFMVYSGKLRVDVPITFMAVDAGTVIVTATVSYQACSMDECFSPRTTKFDLSVDETSLIERPPRPS